MNYELNSVLRENCKYLTTNNWNSKLFSHCILKWENTFFFYEMRDGSISQNKDERASEISEIDVLGKIAVYTDNLFEKNMRKKLFVIFQEDCWIKSLFRIYNYGIYHPNE